MSTSAAPRSSRACPGRTAGCSTGRTAPPRTGPRRPSLVEGLIADAVEAAACAPRRARGRGRRRRVRRRPRCACALRPAPQLARRAAAGPTRCPVRAAGPGRQRRERRAVGRGTLRCRPGRGPRADGDPRHRHRRRAPGGRPAAHGAQRHGRRVRPHAGGAGRPSVRVRAHGLLGAVLLGQGTGPFRPRGRVGRPGSGADGGRIARRAGGARAPSSRSAAGSESGWPTWSRRSTPTWCWSGEESRPRAELLLQPARRTFAEALVGSGHRKEPRILAAGLGPLAGLIGAADLAARAEEQR